MKLSEHMEALEDGAEVQAENQRVAERIADKIIAEAMECGVPRFAVELSPLDIAELEAK